MIERILREPSEFERRMIRWRSRFDLNFVLLVCMLAILVPFVVGLGLEWLFGLASLDFEPYLQFGLAALGVPIAVAWLWKVERSRRRLRHVSEVEELRIKDPVVAAVEEGCHEFPIYILQVDRDTLLYLAGQYLWDPWTYGDADADPSDFPTRAFSLVRIRESGEVIRIELSGPSMDTSKHLPARTTRVLGADSDVLRGTLASLDNALAARLTERDKRKADGLS